MSRTRRLLIVCVAALLACGTVVWADQVTIRYTLWDANQLPAYQKVADNFMAKNPGIKIEITQMGWADYWNDLQTSMVAGTAADVFTDHLAKYPEFAAKGQLLDIEPMVKADKVPTNIYLTGLADLWTRDGKRFGLPKDWDTIAVVYNKDMAAKAGITDAEMNSMTWNPNNGGTFETVLRKFAQDKNGNNGLSAKFDPKNVVRWGIAMDYSNFGAYGQQYWSAFAASTGWKFTDGMYASKYYYDDSRFIQTMQYFADLSRKKGLMPPYEALSAQNVGSTVLFTSQKIGMILDGSWMIGFYGGNTEFKVGFARLPIGPVGRRSMFNGLADSIYIRTQHPKEAWQWVKYLGSAEAQNVVGSYGAVFPAIESGVQAANKAYKEKGLDVTAFTAQALEKNGTFLFPITDHASEINSIMQQNFDSIFLGQATAADGLKAANAKVNATFK
ncbi:MAG: sugar ABC transporter substrate-binding protein [Spirochaetia bacterium]|jgi:multiple sugar transport system substrate-binding protein